MQMHCSPCSRSIECRCPGLTWCPELHEASQQRESRARSDGLACAARMRASTRDLKDARCCSARTVHLPPTCHLNVTAAQSCRCNGAISCHCVGGHSLQRTPQSAHDVVRVFAVNCIALAVTSRATPTCSSCTIASCASQARPLQPCAARNWHKAAKSGCSTMIQRPRAASTSRELPHDDAVPPEDATPEALPRTPSHMDEAKKCAAATKISSDW